MLKDKEQRIKAKKEVLGNLIGLMNHMSAERIRPKKKEEPPKDEEKKKEALPDDKEEMLSKLKDIYSQIKE